MGEITRAGKNFIGYDYKEVAVEESGISMYLDGYLNFGWTADENRRPDKKGSNVVLHLKRDRAIANKMELTRLERYFESCMNEIQILKKSQTAVPVMVSLGIGIAGTVFIAGATFAVTHEPPLTALCALLAVPGFAGWISPYFAYQILAKKQIEKLNPLLEDKYEEIYGICKKGNDLCNY